VLLGDKGLEPSDKNELTNGSSSSRFLWIFPLLLQLLYPFSENSKT
jgi:hypothetical protein